MLRRWLLLSSLVVLGSAEARSEVLYGLGLGVGQTKTSSSEDGELDKTGLTYLGEIGVELTDDNSRYLEASLGFQQYRLTATKSSRDQEVETGLTLLSLGYRWNFGGFEAGIAMLANVGSGASLRVRDVDGKATGVVSAGPAFGYRFGSDQFDSVVLLTPVFDLNVKDELNTSVLLRYQLWCRGAKAPPPVMAEAPPPPPPAIVEAPPPPPQAVEEAPLVLRFKQDTFQFEYNRDDLVSASIGNVKAVAEALAAAQANWETIEIGGHADGSKKSARNQELSGLRAAAIMKGFAEYGVDAGKMTTKGYGIDEPIPGLPANSPLNRRVELKITGVKNAGELKEKLEAFLLPD